MNFYELSSKPIEGECPICLEEFTQPAQNEKLYPSLAEYGYVSNSGISNKRIVAHYGDGGENHPMHEKCMNEWLKTSKFHDCPICRKEIDEKKEFSDVNVNIESNKKTWKERLISYFSSIQTLSTLATVVALEVLLTSGVRNAILGTIGIHLGVVAAVGACAAVVLAEIASNKGQEVATGQANGAFVGLALITLFTKGKVASKLACSGPVGIVAGTLIAITAIKMLEMLSKFVGSYQNRRSV